MYDTQQLTRNGFSPDVLQASFPSCAQGQLLRLFSRGRTAVSGPRASLSPESEISFPSTQRCRGDNPGDSGGGACAQGCLALSLVHLPSGKLSIPQHCSQVAIYGVKVNRDQHVYSLRCEPGEGGRAARPKPWYFQGTWSSEEAGLPQRSLVSLQVPTNANAHGWLTPLPTNLEAVCVKEGLQTSAPPAVGPQATCSMALSFISFLGKTQSHVGGSTALLHSSSRFLYFPVIARACLLCARLCQVLGIERAVRHGLCPPGHPSPDKANRFPRPSKSSTAVTLAPFCVCAMNKEPWI